MRSFEFADGTSAKFWEIDQVGTEVTVRWGRVGTTGQTKVKTFATAAEAATHEGKLIAEKTRKGYGETAATTAPARPSRTPEPTPPAATAPADEDTFVLPAAWHRHRYARRGSTGLATFVPDAKARAVTDELLSRRPGGVLKAF